jgi:hypothetical protein
MFFDEAIPAFNIGDMVPPEMLVESNIADARFCYTCNGKLSRYNPNDRCNPCQETEREVINRSITKLVGEL